MVCCVQVFVGDRTKGARDVKEIRIPFIHDGLRCSGEYTIVAAQLEQGGFAS
jgi:hypothetical protein